MTGDNIRALFQVDDPSRVTKKHLEDLVLQKARESLHVEFKASGDYTNGGCAKTAKAISAFANSDGGVLILGVSEDRKGKVGCIAGLDPLPSKVKKEGLQQRLWSLVAPWPERTYIEDVDVGNGTNVFLIDVPGNHYPPVQVDKTGTYYFRLNAVSEPMPHYMVQNAFNKGRDPSLELITHIFGCQADVGGGRERAFLRITVRNTGRAAATEFVAHVGRLHSVGRIMEIEPHTGKFLSVGGSVHPDTQEPAVQANFEHPIYLGVDSFVGTLSITFSPTDSIRIGLACIECPFRFYKLDLTRMMVDKYIKSNGSSTGEICQILEEVKPEPVAIDRPIEKSP